MFLDTIKKIREQTKIQGLITPVYNGLNISNIGSLILDNFEIQHSYKRLIDEIPIKLPKKKKVIFLLLDALGFKLLNSAREKIRLETFEELIKNGIYMAITSTFPSTTATALPSIYTMSPPSEHGVMGYRFYAREFGDLINPLFQKQSINKNCYVKFDENFLVSIKTIFEILNEFGIPNFSIVRYEYLTSTFDKAVYKGTKELGYLTLSDLLKRIVETLNFETVFINAYWWSIDALSHHYGPNSDVVLNEIQLLDLFLKMLLKEIDKETLLIISADHGQIETSPSKVINLADFEASRDIILPISDVRAPYLFTNGKFKIELLNKFDNMVVLDREEAFNLNLFGESGRYKERVGDFIILLKDDSTIAYISDINEINLVGKHGNLTEEEMITPLILYYKN